MWVLSDGQGVLFMCIPVYTFTAKMGIFTAGTCEFGTNDKALQASTAS